MKTKLTIFSLLALSTIGLTALVGCNSQKETVLIYSCSEDEINADLKSQLDSAFPNYDIVIQYLGTGETYTKLSSEGKNTAADIVFDLDGTYAQKLVDEKDCFTDLSKFNYDWSKFEADVIDYPHRKFVPECKTNVVVAYNEKVLAEHNIPVPTTYAELAGSNYNGLITISNPKASGTGYAFYNTLVSNDGLDATLNYFDSIKPNIREITSSGSAPLKSVNRGESAIGFVMLWQTIEYMNNNSDIKYTFLDKPTGYNVYTFEMVSGKESRTAVKEVFDYIFNTYNRSHVERFYPDKIYVDQENKSETMKAYPTDIPETKMSGLYDFAHKQALLDAWRL